MKQFLLKNKINDSHFIIKYLNKLKINNHFNYFSNFDLLEFKLSVVLNDKYYGGICSCLLGTIQH